jgi:GAF domain-containing protein
MNRLPARELSTLLKVSESLAVSLELDRVLQTAIESAVRVLRLDTGAIYLLDEEVLYLGAAAPPLPRNFPDEFRLASLGDHPHIRRAIRTQRTIYLPDARVARLSASEKAVSEARSLRSVLYIPLLLEGEPVGVLIVGSTRRLHKFTTHERALCRILSSMIALSVANARLFASVQQASKAMTRAYDATLEGWSLALEMRDQATMGHTQRVTHMTLALASEMGIPEGSLEHIRRGGFDPEPYRPAFGGGLGHYAETPRAGL